MAYVILILCIILGGVLGFVIPEIPYAYYNYTAVAILATLDSVFGGLASGLKGKFNVPIFITGYFGNALIAIGLVALGVRLGVDIYLAAVIVFAQRILVNFSVIRRILLAKWDKKAVVEEVEKE